MTSSVKTELEDYVLEKEIGRGELTIVYQGRQKSDGSIIAVKLVAPQFTFDEQFVRRFKEIAQQTTRLEHSNIVRTFEAGQEEDTVFVVRDMIHGRTLAAVIENDGSLPPPRMLAIAGQIADALDYAHQKSIMHGDLSANRVYVDDNDQVTIADFGQTQATVGTSLAKQGYAVGSPEILAPERVRGQGSSRQSDLYSLGILCYQMLNGEPPFTGAPASVLHAQAYEQPRPLHTINPDVSVPLSEAIGRMLSKGLELRYNTGSEFVRALTVATEGSAPVRRTSASGAQFEPGLSESTSLARRPWFWALILIPIIGLLLIVGFGAVTAWLAIQSSLLPESRQAAAPAPVASPTAVEQPAEQPAVAVVEPTLPVAVGSAAESTPAPAPTTTTVPPSPSDTPTLVPLPRPGPPVVRDGSPFTNIKISHGITDDNQPEKIGTSFAPGTPPVYLFFDYGDIEPGTVWTHRWTWGDTELGVYNDVWPDNYFETGTAWVFYSPSGGYQPGPYQVTLEINGQVVATATFVIEPGGL
jgi:serine/threonine-protein kinase